MARRSSRAVREVRKGGFLGKFLCFFLGIFMGIFFIVGAVAGIGYYAYTRPVGQTVKMLPGNIYERLFDETDGALNAKYADMKVGELIGAVKEDIETLTTGNLNSLEGISPLARQKVDDLLAEYLEKFEAYGVNIDKDELMQQNFSEMGTYLTEQVNTIEIAPLIESYTENLDQQSKDILDALFYDEDGNSLTVGGLTEDEGVMGAVKGIGLGVLLNDYKQIINRALVYGPSTRYEYDENNPSEPVMKQMTYTYEDKGEGLKLYDDQGKEMLYYDLTKGELYLKENDTDEDFDTLHLKEQSARTITKTYLAYKDADHLEEATYEKTTFGDLMDNTDAVLYGILLKDILQVTDDSAGILKAIALNDDGSPRSLEYLLSNSSTLMDTISLAAALEIEQGDPNNNAIMEALAFKPDGTERTLQDLNDPELIDELTLKDVLNLEGEGKTYDKDTMTVSTKVLLSLAYGEDYALVEGKPQCADGKEPLKIGDLTGENMDITERILLADALNVKNDNTTHAVLRALVFDENGESRKLSDLTGAGGTDLINNIKIADAMGIKDDSHPILVALAGNGRTLQDLSEDSTNIINGLYLKDALNLIEADPSHNKVLLTLAYGSGYTIVDGKYKPAHDDNLRTIEMLTNDPDLLDGITLADALNIQNDGSNPLLESLAFDSDGNPLTIGELTADGKINEVIEGVALADALGIDKDDPNQHAILKSLVFDEAGNSRTLGELTGEEGAELINGVSLTSILEEDPENALIMFFLRGREGVHYEVVSGKVQALQMRLLVADDGTLYNEYRELLDPAKHTLVGSAYTDTSGDEPITYTVTLATGVTEEDINGQHVDVYYLSQDGAPVYYEGTNLGNVSDRISNLTNRITVGEIIDGESNTFLQHLLKKTLAELPDALNNLTIRDVFETDIFKMDDEKKYYLDKNGNPILDEADYDKRVVTGTWWYLLHNPHCTNATHDNSCITNPKISALSELVTNMTSNVTKASLNELKSDGIITGLEDSTLQTNIIKTISVPSLTYPFTPTQYTLYEGTKGTIGEMTIEELLAYVDNLIIALNALNSIS